MSQWYGSPELTKSYEINERDKKRKYNEQILEVEHGSFAPSVGHGSLWWYGKESK